MGNCREERELDAKYRFAATIADDLRLLPVRAKLLAKNEIRNTLFKYQMEMFHQRDHVGNVSLNNVVQLSGYTELRSLFLLQLLISFNRKQPGEEIIKVFTHSV